MLSSRSTPAASPVQGLRAQREQQQHRRGGGSDDSLPPHPSASSLPPRSPTTYTNNSRNTTARGTFHASESGSPAVTAKPQSPLRQNVSFGGDNFPGLRPPSSLRGVIDFANSRVGRTNMSYTGDQKNRGRKSSGGGGGDQHSDTMSPISESPTPKNASPATAGSSSSRFAFFSSAIKGIATSASSSPVSVPQDDELMNLDIDNALFPARASADGDAFSPAAYKNLQQTATGLLHRFQAAYQQRTIAYQELKAERGAQADEKEEAQTRMRHLKMQLEDMARKAAEQEAVMQSLMEELTREKKLRMEERQARDKGTSLSEGSSVSEDLNAEDDQQRRKWRCSGGTAKSDVGFDTDDESSIEEASVFSRSRSPTIATTTTDVSPVEGPLTQIKTPAIVTPRTPRAPPLPSQQQQKPQMNTFQKLFKGISGDASRDGGSWGPNPCRNCEGQDASVAWDTVNLLKDENRGLKDRVGELETAVEAALDVVHGIGL